MKVSATQDVVITPRDTYRLHVTLSHGDADMVHDEVQDYASSPAQQANLARDLDLLGVLMSSPLAVNSDAFDKFEQSTLDELKYTDDDLDEIYFLRVDCTTGYGHSKIMAAWVTYFDKNGIERHVYLVDKDGYHLKKLEPTK